MLTIASLLAQTETPDAVGGNGAGIVGLIFALLSAVAVFAVFFGLPVWGIVDAIRRPPADWDAAGQSKSLWIAIQFFVWMFGSVIYVIAVRPRLKRAARVAEDSEHA